MYHRCEKMYTLMHLMCAANVSGMYHGCIMMIITMCLSCIIGVYWNLYPTPLFSTMLCPSLFWGPAYPGIQFQASAAHGSCSRWLGLAMAWQHQKCCFADLACKFQHSVLDAVLQISLLVRHPHGTPTLHAPGLTHWAALGGQTGLKRQ